MAKFMTAATLRNMPAYLAEDRARRAEGRADEERKRQEELRKRMQEMGQNFMSQGDFTPEGLQKFAESNQMSMPEMKGMVDMVMGFKKLGKETAAPRVPNIWATKGGVKTRVADVLGVTSDIAVPAGGQPKVPDWMKFGRDTLKSSLGFTAESGWADPASQQKFDTVLADMDTRMQGKDPKDVISVMHGAITDYDKKTGVAEAVTGIPEDSIMTTVSDAKKATDKALEAGALPADIKMELEAKGWSKSKVKQILGSSGTSANPLGL